MRDKGSTLLLGMIIVSIVLASGIGVSTILVRQLREVADREAVAVSRYVAETVGEKVQKGLLELPTEGWEDVDWKGVEREIRYKGEENKKEYTVTVNIGDNYYVFSDDLEKEEENGEENGEDMIFAYYDDPNNWKDDYGAVTVRYRIDGSEISGYSVLKEMEESSYEGWLESHITKEEIEGTHIRVYYCPGPKEGNEGCSNEGDTSWREVEEFKKASLCGLEYCLTPESALVYYDNHQGWDGVNVRYRIDGSEISGYSILKEMEESSYEGWLKSHITKEEIEGTHIRFNFCPGDITEPDSCDHDQDTTWRQKEEVIKNIFCVEEGVREECTAP